jgi:hypothetical protein
MRARRWCQTTGPLSAIETTFVRVRAREDSPLPPPYPRHRGAAPPAFAAIPSEAAGIRCHPRARPPAGATDARVPAQADGRRRPSARDPLRSLAWPRLSS